MKVKTSVTIDSKTWDKLKTLAKREDRSVSNVLERFIKLQVKGLKAGQHRPRRQPRPDPGNGGSRVPCIDMDWQAHMR